MCTKVPYASRWLAQQALFTLCRSGLDVRSIHPCFEDHPGAWHVTSKASHGRWMRR